MKPKKKRKSPKVIRCGFCSFPVTRCICKKKEPTCNGANYHVFALGEDICSICKWDRRKHKDRRRVFRVWVNQVNQTYVDVMATSVDEAREKGYTKWRKEMAHSQVSYVEEQNK